MRKGLKTFQAGSEEGVVISNSINNALPPERNPWPGNPRLDGISCRFTTKGSRVWSIAPGTSEQLRIPATELGAKLSFDYEGVEVDYFDRRNRIYDSNPDYTL